MNVDTLDLIRLLPKTCEWCSRNFLRPSESTIKHCPCCVEAIAKLEQEKRLTPDEMRAIWGNETGLATDHQLAPEVKPRQKNSQTEETR